MCLGRRIMDSFHPDPTVHHNSRIIHNGTLTCYDLCHGFQTEVLECGTVASEATWSM